MEEFPPNSIRSRAPETPNDKKIERVTQSDPIRRKKTLGAKFKETFISGDQGVWSYVVSDVLIPAAKDAISDAVTEGIQRMLFGDTIPSRRRPSLRGPSNYVSYNRYSEASTPREEPRPTLSRRARASHDFDEIILATRIEAEEVLNNLYNLLEKYDSASVADLYELVGVNGQFTDDKWGWTDLRGSGISRIREGYLLNLPKPVPLD